MVTAAKKTSTKKPGAKPAKSAPRASRQSDGPDAVKLLTADHREVKGLFQQYQELVDAEAEDDVRHPIAQQICLLLTIHAQIEEEIFYPAAQDAIKEPDLVDEATVEHASAKDLIAQLKESNPSEHLFDAKVKVLGEYIDHHVKEEEGELFPQSRRAKMDMAGLGAQLRQRKAELMEEMGMAAEFEDPADEDVAD